ncbi:mCG147651 [Mus musculus]|nr:mCG147651 [Mus musculus]
MALMVSCPGRPLTLDADGCCRSTLSFSGCFCVVVLGGQIVLIRADLGTDRIGRKRTECISWDGLLSECKSKGPGLCWQPGRQ